MSSTSPATPSSPEPPIRTYGPGSLVAMAAICGGIGFFFWLYGHFLQPKESEDKIQTVTANPDSENAKTQNAIPPTPSPTARPDSGTNDDLKRQTQDLKQLHQEIAKQLVTLREKSVAGKIPQDRRLARISELRRFAEEVDETLQELRKEYAECTALQTSLMANDRGRQIANNAGQLALVASLLDRQIISERQVQAWQDQLEQQFQTIRSAAIEAESTVDISTDFLKDTDRLGESIRKALANLKQKHSALKGVLATVGTVLPGSDAPTLEAALESYRNHRDKQREEFLAAEANRLREDYTQKLAEERRQTEKELGEAELAKERRIRELELAARKASSDAEAQAVTDAVAAIKAQAEAERIQREKAALTKRFEAEYPRMKAVLIPLTAEGFAQPTGGAGPANTKIRGPVSLTKMKAAGHLDNDPTGMQGLVNLGNASSNDRPRGSFPPQSGLSTPASRRAIDDIQQFINRYGEIMVEKGLLAP